MAWTVVLSHVLHLSGYDDAMPLLWLKVLLNGTAAVNVFIVVSGFVITHLLLVRNERYGPYLVRRALRIIPIYYVCLLSALILLPAQVEFHTHEWIGDHATWAHRFDAFEPRLRDHLLWHATLLHGIVPDSILPQSAWSILGPAWSLSLEWQFYLVAPALVWLLRINRLVEALVVILLLALHAWLHRQTGLIWEWPSFLPLSIHFFLLGILCRLHLPALLKLRPWAVPVAGLTASAIFRSRSYELLVWTFFLTAVLLEAGVSGSRSLLKQRVAGAATIITQNRLAVLLGRSSYSTYLVHIPFLSGLTWIGEHGFGLHSRGAITLIVLPGLPLLALLSVALYRFVEAPCIRLGARIVAARPIVPTQASA